MTASASRSLSAALSAGPKCPALNAVATCARGSRCTASWRCRPWSVSTPKLDSNLMNLIRLAQRGAHLRQGVTMHGELALQALERLHHDTGLEPHRPHRPRLPLCECSL